MLVLSVAAVVFLIGLVVFAIFSPLPPRERASRIAWVLMFCGLLVALMTLGSGAHEHAAHL